MHADRLWRVGKLALIVLAILLPLGVGFFYVAGPFIPVLRPLTKHVIMTTASTDGRYKCQVSGVSDIIDTDITIVIKDAAGAVLANGQYSDPNLAFNRRIDWDGNQVAVSFCESPEFFIQAIVRPGRVVWLQNIHDADLGALDGCDAINRLFLREPDLTNAAFAHLRTCPKLESLALDAPQLKDQALAAFAGLPSLTELLIQRASFSDNGLSALSSFPNLRKLVLYQQSLSDDAIPRVAECSSLNDLTLDGPPFTCRQFDQLRKIKGLTTLMLSGETFTDVGFSAIGEVRSLMSLSLYSTGISQEEVDALHMARPEMHITVNYTPPNLANRASSRPVIGHVAIRGY